MTAQASSVAYKIASTESRISPLPTTGLWDNNPYQTAKGAVPKNRHSLRVIPGGKENKSNQNKLNQDKPNQDKTRWAVSNVATEEFDACISLLSNQVQDLPMLDIDLWSPVFKEEPIVAIYNPSKSGLFNTGSYDSFLLDTLQEYYETSEYIRHKIISGIDRQLRIAKEDRPDIVLSKPSHSGLFNFAKAYKITTVPFVVLQDNGNLSVSWDYETGDEFNLTFLRDGSLNFVAFLNRTKEKESIIHGNDSIDGVIKFIQYNEIVL